MFWAKRTSLEIIIIMSQILAYGSSTFQTGQWNLVPE